jgi:hypothetical protein
MRKLIASALAGTALVVSACSFPTDSVTLGSVSIVRADTVFTKLNDSRTFKTQIFDAAKNEISDLSPPWQWTSRDPTVASVSGTGGEGKVTAVKAGTTRIVAEIRNGLADSITVIVRPATR